MSSLPDPDPDAEADRPDHPDRLDDAGRVAAPTRRPPHLALLIGPIIFLVICSNVGAALFPQLVSDNPLLLITLSAPNRNLILASHQLPFGVYLLVGTLRLLAPDWFFWALGRHYGNRAITWMERRTASLGTLMRELERLFGRWGYALVLIFPNNPVCLIAGASTMRRSVFWTLNIVGTIGRVLLMWWIGDVLQAQIDTVLGWISEYRIPLLVVTVGLVLLSGMREFRSGTSQIQQLMELEDELSEDGPNKDRPSKDGSSNDRSSNDRSSNDRSSED